VITSSRLAWTSAIAFALALFYAPLAYGCTRPDVLPPLFALLGAGILIGGIAVAFNQRRRAISGLVLLCVAAILLQGWLTTWDPVFHRLDYINDGMVDRTAENIRQLSFDSMLATSFLLGSFVVLCELIVDAGVRRFLLAAALSGVLTCILGIAMKIGGAPVARHFWGTEGVDWNNFAMYRYHGNAGAFLNLVWPLILVFARRTFSPKVGLIQKILWTLAALACGVALIMNASKASLVIGLLILPWPFLTWLTSLPRKTLFGLVAGALCLIAAGMFALSKITYESALSRMAHGAEVSASASGRMQAYQQYMNALPEIGFFGVGPGLFQITFPYESSPLGNVEIGLREYAHEDYFQTVIEWGWFGSIWWVILGAGGVYQAFRSYARRELFTSRTDRHLLLAAILGVLGTLAQALVDFPLQIASIRLFFFLLLALCWSSPHLLESPSIVTPFRRSARATSERSATSSKSLS
jgi:hypothetical protein